MPIVISKDIPAFDVLSRENVFVMSSSRAQTQDIRPIEIAIVNLMPTKIETETQLMRLLANTPLQVNLTLVRTATYNSTNTSQDHMEKFYVTFDELAGRKFDGMIVTGAPVEKMEFADVKYWDELCKIMDYAEKNVTSSLFICWGAQAAMNYYFGVGKKELPKKLFGVFDNHICQENEPLLRGLNDTFRVPHSRYTEIKKEDMEGDGRIVILAEGEDCGVSIAKCIDNRRFFFFGHSEYDRDTLKKEYLRDKEKGLDIDPPKNYFADKECTKVDYSWRSTGTLLFSNWLNYYVYQLTPYDIGRI
ncbi:MAG: homoserine O-succinyltransferase [Clostridia bacterium]|nr:homoserine O-succinyltransferase [Clostridia bacterium]